MPSIRPVVILAASALVMANGAVGQAPPRSPLGPAPAGDAIAISSQVIRENFDGSACPSVARAARQSDGSIRATCSNGEAFRIMSLDGQPAAMRCSAAARLGMPGC